MNEIVMAKVHCIVRNIVTVHDPVLVLRGMNCKFAGFDMYSLAVLQYKEVQNNLQATVLRQKFC
jgi:hypothetical protein